MLGAVLANEVGSYRRVNEGPYAWVAICILGVKDAANRHTINVKLRVLLYNYSNNAILRNMVRSGSIKSLPTLYWRVDQ